MKDIKEVFRVIDDRLKQATNEDEKDKIIDQEFQSFIQQLLYSNNK